MATDSTLRIPDDLMAVLQARAAQEGRSVDEVAERALRRALDQLDWDDLLAYGRERAAASGYTEADVPALVKAWRREQRRQ